MKVWQLDPFNLTPYYDAAFCTALERAGCTVRWITSPYLYDAALPAGAADYVYFRSLDHPCWLHYPHLRRIARLALYPLGHRALLRQLDGDPPDIIHLQWSRIPRLDRWLVKQIRQRGIPVVHTIHDVDPLFHTADAAELAKLYAEVDRLIVHAPANRMALLQRHPNLGNHVRIVPHIALDWPTSLDMDRASARRQLGIPANAIVLLFFGSIRAYKGLETLIDAFVQARMSLPDVWLVIAGRPDSRRTDLALQQLGTHTVIHPDYIPSDQVWCYHLAADIAIIPYRQVSQSGTLITAMGFGLPTIVTRVGSLPETVEDSGWIIPPDNPEALAQAIRDAANDPDRRKQMGQHAQQIIKERHSPEQIAAQMLPLYEEVLCSASST